MTGEPVPRPTPKSKRLVLFAVIVGVLVALPAILSPRIAAAKARAKRINCVCHEKQLGIAFRGFGIDNGAFPMHIPNTNDPASAPP